jgi:hypothetical protein
MTATEKAAYERATAKGTAFSNKNDAISKLKNDQAAKTKYKSTFDVEPTKRPEYIPTSTKSSSGQSIPITYDASRHGYGYIDPVTSTWIMYDVFSDALMYDAILRQNDYIVVPQGSKVTTASAQGSSGVASFIIGFLVVAVIVVATAFVIMNNKNIKSNYY